MNERNALGLTLCVSLALLCGCASGQSAARPSNLLPSTARDSWMSANLASQDLLYVSNSDNEVTVYSYSQHTLVGVLTDFTLPRGECADASGDVYITDYAAEQILEYAHGGGKPLKKLDDAPDSPYACSVDPTTGNLAVANDDGTSKEGNIAIYAGASGTPTRYADSSLYNFEGCAYDKHGNLLVTNGSGNPAAFAWLPVGGTRLVTIRVPGPDPSWKWYNVGAIEWDGKYFVINDYNLYRISVTHGQAFYIGSTSLDPGSYYPFWIYNDNSAEQGTQVVGSVYSDSQNGVDYFDYPSGGDPTYQITHGVDDPSGVTISLGKH